MKAQPHLWGELKKSKTTCPPLAVSFLGSSTLLFWPSMPFFFLRDYFNDLWLQQGLEICLAHGPLDFETSSDAVRLRVWSPAIEMQSYRLFRHQGHLHDRQRHIA